MHWTSQDFLWLFTPSFELLIAVRVFQQGLWREYPVFWSYLLAEIFRAALLFGMGSATPHYARYFYAYWITECFVCLLGFFVVAEVFRKAFARRLGLSIWGTRLFRLSLLLLVGVALVVASAAPGNDSSKLIAGILVVKRAESLVRLGLVAALFLFVVVLGVSWANQAIGIAAGFGVYGAVELAAIAIRSHYGREANALWKWAPTAADLGQKLLWAAYFLRVKQRSDPPGPIGSSKDRSTDKELEKMREAVGVLIER